MIRHTSRLTKTLLAAMATALLAASGAALAQAPRVAIGVLSCRVDGGVGFVFGSTKKLDCLWRKTDGSEERYYGVINRFGIDVGVTVESAISWGVLSTTNMAGRGALGGTYAGVSAEATMGLGLGANVLLGGSLKSIALQPLSVQAQQGLNIAAGIAALELRPEGL